MYVCTNDLSTEDTRSGCQQDTKEGIRGTAATYILNVEAVVLWVTKRCVHCLDDEILFAFVCETHEELHWLASWEFCTENMFIFIYRILV